MNQVLVSIPDLFASIATALRLRMGPFANGADLTFAHGSYEAVKALVERKEDGVGAPADRASFPMLWLITPVEQGRGHSDGVTDLRDVQLLLLMSTTPDLTESEQYDQVFVPCLWPIYEQFLKQLEYSGLFEILSVESIPHRMREWTYRSVGEGESRNLFDKALCAIQIQGLQLTVNESVPVNYKQTTKL